jgi:hypothetical protein
MAAITSAVIGTGLGIAQAAVGFTQSAKAKKAARQAERDAANLFADARRRASVNVYEELSVPFDAYERGFETNLQADIQALSALQEADSRALAGGVGRVGAQQAAQAEGVRIGMADEMFNLEKLKADAEENIKQQQISMDIAEARREDQKRIEELQKRQQALQQGIKGLGEGMVAAAGFFPGGMGQTLGTGQQAPKDMVGIPQMGKSIFDPQVTQGSPGMAAIKRFAPSLGSGDMAQGFADMQSQYMPQQSIFEFSRSRGLTPPTGLGVTSLRRP